MLSLSVGGRRAEGKVGGGGKFSGRWWGEFKGWCADVWEVKVCMCYVEWITKMKC